MDPIATASNLQSTMPSLDLSWTITAAIAVIALFSPIIVALINNHHARIIREMDITHAENLKNIELNQHIMEKQFEIYYADKKAAFDEFLKNAGSYTAHRQSLPSYESLLSSANRAILFCNTENQALLYNFMERVDNEFFGGGCTKSERVAYASLLFSIAQALNRELLSTQPSTNRI